MDVEGKKWLSFPRYSEIYRQGVLDFVSNAFENHAIGNELKCPCRKCINRFWSGATAICDHLICNGPSPQCVD